MRRDMTKRRHTDEPRRGDTEGLRLLGADRASGWGLENTAGAARLPARATSSAGGRTEGGREDEERRRQIHSGVSGGRTHGAAGVVREAFVAIR